MKSWKFPYSPRSDSRSIIILIFVWEVSGHLQQIKSEQWKIRVNVIDDMAKKLMD